MKTIWLKTTLALSLGAVSAQALSGGFALNEHGASGMGTSFAGRSSSADDATTLYGNPAGLARLDREQVSVGATMIYGKTDIEDASGTAAGSNDGDMVPFTTVPNGYYVKPIDDRWAFGIGVYVPFGLLTDYEGGFQGRYFGDYSEVRVITVQPTVSFRVNDQLSIGFGPTINRIDGELRSAFPPLPPAGTSDSRVKIKGDDTALGFNVGVLYEFTPRTRAGLTYHSKVDYTLEGDTRISGTNPTLTGIGAYGKYDASLDLQTPESVDFSITHQLDDGWTLYGGALWTRWSRLESIVVENKGVPAGPASALFGDVAEEQNWHDTWAYALGASYQLNPQWVLRAGVSIDASPTNNTERSPRIPTGDRRAISLGFGWSPSSDVTIDVAYSYLKEEDIDIDRTSALGSYRSTYKNSAHGLGAELSYRF
jgi:long-chain fatty acid transport protein